MAVRLDAARDHRHAQAAAAVVAAGGQAAAVRGRARPGQGPVQRNPGRSRPGHPEGAGAVTTFKTAESPFKSDNTASNRTGFTLMNNQVGEVVAQVMATKPNVTVTNLPSMMRVDAIGRMGVVYDEISGAAG